MNIYEIKKELNANKEIKRLKARTKRIQNQNCRIVIKQENEKPVLGIETWVYENEKRFYPFFESEKKEQQFGYETYNELKEQMIEILYEIV